MDLETGSGNPVADINDELDAFATAPSSSDEPLCESVRRAVQRYFNDMEGHLPQDLYKTVLHEMERPLLEVVMDELGGNQSKAADVLGLNRTTLRKKLQTHGLGRG